MDSIQINITNLGSPSPVRGGASCHHRSKGLGKVLSKLPAGEGCRVATAKCNVVLEGGGLIGFSFRSGNGVVGPRIDFVARLLIQEHVDGL